MRKLVTIRKVISIEEIAGADRIELVKIDGWQCISQKSNFKIGDLAVYHEIDSFLNTSRPAYDFLAKDAKTWEGKVGYRLRTKKLKKTLSQGLLIPIADFPELKPLSLIEGQDVTELLGVLKWELPEPNQMNVRTPGIQQAGFPWFIPKTDEERVQNLPNVLETQKDKYFEVTEKLDGTSATYFFGGPNKEFGVCSRNIWMKNRTKRWYGRLWLKIKSWFKTLEVTRINSYWQIAKKYKLEEILPYLNKQYAFQGEIIGEGIQKNHYKLTGQEFYIFNIYDIENFRYLNPEERVALITSINFLAKARNEPELKHVPVYTTMKLSDAFSTIQEIIENADGGSLINTKVSREGLVFKCANGEFSFKAISNKYLLKEE